MADLPGICGPANRPCKIAHSSTFPNQVGVYPSAFLPSAFTIWHAVFASQFPLSQAEFGVGDFAGIGAGTLDVVGGGFAPTLPSFHDFQSHHYVIFARTANRINTAYTLTKEDIDNINAEGIGEIDVGEFVFEFVSVTDEPIDADITLTDAEKEALKENPECTIGCSEESAEDRKFRLLFELDIEGNRFIGIVFNELGVEYRLDNGTDKSKTILDQSGLGDLDNASYRDGSSRKITVRLKSFNAEGEEELEGSLKEGNIIYLTYLAVKEHYIRQRVVISWKIIDPGTAAGPGAQCIGLINSFNVAHYRFFEWDMEPEPGSLVTKLAGWRAVESFNANPNFVATLNIGNETVLADFVAGAPDSATTHVFRIIPGETTPSRLKTFIDDRRSSPEIGINLDRLISDGAFHTNAGDGTNNSAFQNADWFTRNQFTKYTNHTDANDHVFFNVHRTALRKRDVDKFGIERFLAQELEKDINAGKITFFPFMDNPKIDNPTLGTAQDTPDTPSEPAALKVSRTFLNSSNTKFAPVNPVTGYGGNFEVVCGSVGSFPASPAFGINSYHSFESNKISERFEKDTHILVERNFAVNVTILGPRLITIEGGAGGTGTSVTCIADSAKDFQFAGHTNADEFLVYNTFNNGQTEKAIRTLSFRPDQGSSKNRISPTTDQFENLVGTSGMIGDIPGIQPGKAISLVSFTGIDTLTFKTTEPDKLKLDIAQIKDSQIEVLPIPDPNVDPLVIVFNESYCGSLVIRYSLDDQADTENGNAVLLAKSGENIIGSVGNILISLSSKSFRVNFNWLNASSLELIGDRVKHMTVEAINLQSIIPARLNDFLNEQNSHSNSFTDVSVAKRLDDRSLFFSSDVVSISEDERGFLYMFFNDADGGISVTSSNDFGLTWTYYYGIVERIGEIESKNPFVVTNSSSNSLFLFFQFGGKILCKNISFKLFDFKDANLIQRFEQDIFQPGDGDILPKEDASVFSNRGKLLRRSILSYVAAGDLGDTSFLEIIGKVPGENEFEYVPFEKREVEGVETSVRINPIARGPSTAFTNSDINDLFFSAYRKDNGELRLWFLNFAEESSSSAVLQCHFSIDNGQSWYDLWEFLENKYNRFRVDSDKNTQFIDRSAPNELPENIFATDPQAGDQVALFGINIHWSRLKRHKIDSGGGEVTIDSESQVLEISSPYVFYQSMTNRVFLFYIYEGCLLCKMFNDVSLGKLSSNFLGNTGAKNIIERQIRAHFIDGPLIDPNLQEELHGFANVTTKEIMSEGNVIFKYPFAVENFGSDRVLSPQRVCALDLPSGLVRVFYKHSDGVSLKSALWTGSEWWAEDFLRNPKTLPDLQLPDQSEFSKVTGGFGGTGF